MMDMAFEPVISHLIRGPLVWAAFIIFFGGLAAQTIRLWHLTRRVQLATVKPPEDRRQKAKKRQPGQWARFRGRTKTTALGASPLVTAVSIIFHVCLFITPVFFIGHNLLIKTAFGVSIVCMPTCAANILTLVVIAGGLFFFFRRLFVTRVRAITTAYDFMLLFIVLLPFITGFITHQRLFPDYRLMITLHILTGEIMLIMIPFSKFFHMIFFFFGRFLIVSEYSLGRPGRIWRFHRV